MIKQRWAIWGRSLAKRRPDLVPLNYPEESDDNEDESNTKHNDNEHSSESNMNNGEEDPSETERLDLEGIEENTRPGSPLGRKNWRGSREPERLRVM